MSAHVGRWFFWGLPLALLVVVVVVVTRHRAPEGVATAQVPDPQPSADVPPVPSETPGVQAAEAPEAQPSPAGRLPPPKFNVTAKARRAPVQLPPPKPRPGHDASYDGLGLTEEQITRARTITARIRQEVRQAALGDKAHMRERIHALKAQADKELTEVMGPEKFAIFLKRQESIAEQMQAANGKLQDVMGGFDRGRRDR